jgi:hypothetical protein
MGVLLSEFKKELIGHKIVRGGEFTKPTISSKWGKKK